MLGYDEVIEKAVERGVACDVLSKLIEHAEASRMVEAKRALTTALARFQGMTISIPKTKEVVGTGSFKYRYAPLDVIISHIAGPLSKCGLSFYFDSQYLDSGIRAVTCHLMHESGVSISSTFGSVANVQQRLNPTQQTGWLDTYCKRYALCNVTGIVATEDDADGNGIEAFGATGRAEATQPSGVPPQPAGRGQNSIIDNYHLMTLRSKIDAFDLPVMRVKAWMEKAKGKKELASLTYEEYDFLVDALPKLKAQMETNNSPANT